MYTSIYKDGLGVVRDIATGFFIYKGATEAIKAISANTGGQIISNSGAGSVNVSTVTGGAGGLELGNVLSNPVVIENIVP
jgi:hypothetical protein